MTTGSNWVQHSGSRQRRLCARPGCGAPAAATLRFQPTQREAWLVALEEDAARTEGDLCARHAAGLVLPRGWELHNDLPTAADPARKPPPARRSQSIARSRRRRTSTAVQLPGLNPVAVAESLETVPESVPESGPDRQPEVTQPTDSPAPLVADASREESEALAETLDAQTPLLRRAFRNLSLPE